jgi:poly(A) polymerase
MPTVLQRVPASTHKIDPTLLDANSLEVVAKLRSAGFDAYLVGGCVRDLLLGEIPKDFDVATDATPEEVKGVFRRARLVGRRFRIAHVRFGRDIIEVSTFRKGESSLVELNSDGMILSDNEYGTLAEDALRRDFTINALYYDPLSGDLLDYVDALKDLKSKRIAFIGHTDVRLAEDPVRAIRALRFKAKLKFDIADPINSALPEAARRLQAIPSARLFEEFSKLFLLGYAHAAWHVISSSPLHQALFPGTHPTSELVSKAMRNTDARIAADKPATPGFLLAVLLWEDYVARTQRLMPMHPILIARNLAADQSIATQTSVIAIPRRYSIFVREVWFLQPGLEEPSPKTVERLASHKRFRAAYDLLDLRAQIDPALTPIFDWWTRYQAQPDLRLDLVAALPRERKPASGRRRRRSRKSAGATVTSLVP